MVTLAQSKRTDQKTRESDTGWESVRLAATSRRRWRWGITAAALVAAGAAVAAGAGLAGDDTRTVAVVTADLPAGHVVTAADVGAIDLAHVAGWDLLAPEEVEGAVLARPLGAGSPVLPGAVADTALWPGPGEAVVAVPVTTLPQAVVDGALVEIVTAHRPAAEGEGAGEPAGTVLGRVHRVRTADDQFGGADTVVEVVLARHQAPDVARAASGNGVQMVVVNTDEAPHDDSTQEEEG